MELLKWTLISLYALGALGTVLLIGQDRKPITPGVAALTILANAGMIWWVATTL